MGVSRVMNKPKQQILFKNMDLFIFKWLDKFQQTEQYTQILNTINQITPEVKSLLTQIFGISIFLVPFILLSLLYFHNSNMKDTIEMKENALSLAESILSKSKELRELRFKYVTRSDFSSEQDYLRLLQKLIDGTGIDKSDVSVSSFDSVTLNQDIHKTQTSIQINSVTFNQFKLFLTKISAEKGTKIIEFKIKKNLKTNLLDITLKAQHLFLQSMSDNDFDDKD